MFQARLFAKGDGCQEGGTTLDLSQKPGARSHYGFKAGLRPGIVSMLFQFVLPYGVRQGQQIELRGLLARADASTQGALGVSVC